MERSVMVVRELDGQVTAILEGERLSVTAPTRQDALDRLRFRAERILRGEIEHTTLDLPEAATDGLNALAGAFADDPDLPGIVEAAYAARDEAPYGGL